MPPPYKNKCKLWCELMNVVLKQTFHILKGLVYILKDGSNYIISLIWFFMDNLVSCSVKVARDESIYIFSYIHLFRDSSMFILLVEGSCLLAFEVLLAGLIIKQTWDRLVREKQIQVWTHWYLL